MDQFNIALRYIKKYYFWGVCALVMLLVLGAWWTASGTLADGFTAREGELKAVQSSMSTITSAQDPPNAKVVKDIKKRTRNLSEDLLATWDFLHDQQWKSFQWPADPDLIELPNFDPHKQKKTIRSSKDIPRTLCERYASRIGPYFRKMVEGLDLLRPDIKDETAVGDGAEATTEMEPTTTRRSSSAMGRGAASTEDLIGIVDWDEKNLQEIEALRFKSDNIRTPFQVRVAQEDFWLFENFVRCVEQINEGATSQFNAKVKKITSVMFAQEAVQMFIDREKSPIIDPKNFAKKEEANTEMMSQDSPMAADEGSSSDEEDDGTTRITSEYRTAYEDRYVDINGTPMTAKQFKTFSSTSEYRLMPVYISIVIDQASISDFLGLLINSPFPMEIKTVLINPGQGWKPQFDFSRFEEKESDRSSGSARSRTVRTPGAGDSRRAPATSNRTGIDSNNKNITSNDFQVDIYGIITMYNLPDSKGLIVAQEEEDLSSEDSGDELSDEDSLSDTVAEDTEATEDTEDAEVAEGTTPADDTATEPDDDTIPAPAPATADENEPAEPATTPAAADENEPAEPAATPAAADENEPAEPAATPAAADENEPAEPAATPAAADENEPAE